LRLLAVRFSTSCGQIFNFLRLLAVRLSASCVLNVLADNPQKEDIFTSCDSLRVLAAQEVLAPLLARALFLGFTLRTDSSFNTSRNGDEKVSKPSRSKSKFIYKYTCRD